MQEKQAAGLDTKAMLPILVCIYIGIAELFFPWFSMPVLKYYDRPTVYGIWNLGEGLDNLQKCITEGGKLAMKPLSVGEVQMIQNGITLLQKTAVVSVIFLLFAIVMCCRKKERSVWWLRISLLPSLGATVMSVMEWYLGNDFLNRKLERTSDFINFTLHSYLQLTAYPYAQLILSVVILISAGKLLNIREDMEMCVSQSRSLKRDQRYGKRTKTALILILFGVPLCIFFGIFFLNDRSESFIALCIIGLAMLPFFMIFEDRRPQTRELLLIAVMTTLAVVGRVAFFMLPQFKPVTAIVIITGIGLGGEAGFLTGALAGFVSNFFFGQGPWTPWQMSAFGAIGFLSGIIFHGKRKKYADSRFLLCAYGGVVTLVVYGFIMDTSSVTFFTGEFEWKTLLATYISGFPFNVVHGISTAVFLFFMARPMSRKLKRIKKSMGFWKFRNDLSVL